MAALALAFPGRAPAQDPEPWAGNQIGINQTVPPPWTALQVDSAKVACWGRVTDFAGRALPAQITTQNVPLLVAPVSLKVGFDQDTLQVAEPGAGAVTAETPDRVVWEGALSAADIPVKTRVDVEFDGFTWLTLTLGPAPDKPVKRLALEFAVQENAARFYTKDFAGYAPALLLDMWGTVDRSRRLKLQQAFHLCNDEVGLGLYAEGRLGWLIERRDRQMEVLKENGQVVVRYNLIDLFVPQAIATARTIAVGWNALPVRPMPKDGRRYVVVTGFGGDTAAEQRWFDTGMTPVFIRWNAHYPPAKVAEAVAKREPSMLTDCNAITVPRPVDPDFVRDYMKRLHATAPCHVVPYTVGNEHFVPDPVLYRHLAEWSARPVSYTPEEVAKLNDAEGWHTVPVCGWAQGFSDYKAWFMTEAVKDVGWDGFYYDNQIFVPCENPAHTEHQFVDQQGKRIPVTPIRRYRELYKRIYREVKAARPDSLIVGHGCSAAYPFIDIAIGGEALLKLAGETDFYPAFVKPEHCKSLFFNGHPLGVPYLWLPEYRGEFYIGAQSAAATRAMLSLLWLTDSSYWVAWSNLNVLQADARVRGHFRIWEAEWLPYWSQEAVTADKDGVYVSVYRKPDSALLVVCNPGQTTHDRLTLSVDLGQVFAKPPAQEIRAVDAEFAEYSVVGFKPDELQAKFRMQTTPLEAARTAVVEKTMLDVKLAVGAQDLRLVRLEAVKP